MVLVHIICLILSHAASLQFQLSSQEGGGECFPGRTREKTNNDDVVVKATDDSFRAKTTQLEQRHKQTKIIMVILHRPPESG